MPSLIITFLVVALLIGLFVYQTTKNKSAASQESFITLLEQVLSDDIKGITTRIALQNFLSWQSMRMISCSWNLLMSQVMHLRK